MAEFAIHRDPVWRDRANFVINAELAEKDGPRRFEQLLARQLGEDRFEVCCIPFFVSAIALGDVVVPLRPHWSLDRGWGVSVDFGEDSFSSQAGRCRLQTTVR